MHRNGVVLPKHTNIFIYLFIIVVEASSHILPDEVRRPEKNYVVSTFLSLKLPWFSDLEQGNNMTV